MDKDTEKDYRERPARRIGPRPHPAERHLTRLEQLFQEGTEEEFTKALIAFGRQRGSPEFDEALTAFRTEQQRRRSQP